ncbi:hypothetical protein [Nocardia puris]|uniref:hypothetical protein n=1 Tax=Nocardia puris TaxID=208602 RepID=UPI002E206F50
MTDDLVRWVPVTLQIQVRTTCVVGTEPRDSHDVDVTTVVDENGLPFIPKNRMSARLRDAALTVLGGPPEPVLSTDTALALFGGAYTTEASRRGLHVGAAVWPRQAQASVVRSLRSKSGRYPGAGRLFRQRITEALTVEIAQTAIGADGVALPGSLRFARGIRPGVVLEAPLRWSIEPTSAHVGFLARCVLALTQIGEGRSDNLGRVVCSLDGDFGRTRDLAYPVGAVEAL